MMRLHLLTSLICLTLLGVAVAQGQTARKPSPSPEPPAGGMTATAAFAEIALKRAEYEADLEALLVDYTEDFPKVKELRYALTRIEAETDRLKALKASDRDRATTALGKLMIRKVESEIELWKLEQSYADGHPEVRRAKKRVEIFERAIKEVLG